MEHIKLIFRLLFYLSFLMPSLQVIGQEKLEKNKVVVIDPGHGGIDSGAIGTDGIEEKAIVLNIAKNIVEINNKISNGKIDIYLTRYSDTLISLSDRTRLAKGLKADLFISLHCNQSENSNAKGTEVYIYLKSKIQAKKSGYLGFVIQKGLADLLGIKNRGIKYGNFQVLRDNYYSNISILLELGYMSQMDEAIYLSTEESQYAIASNILQSIIKFSGL